MNIFSNRKAQSRVLKTISVLTAVATVLSLSGFMYFSPNYASAVTPSDYGLKEGNTISAAGSDDPDVYIVNDWGYKRLFLNPVIFGFYGHLGGFGSVKNVSAATRDAFPTSGLFRLDGDEKVYGVETTGEDTGMLHWVNTTGAQAVADDPNFFKKVFIINQNEFNWYSKGSNYTSVSQVPSYSRTPGTVVVTGPLSVSLAAGNPAAGTVTKNAQGIEFLRAKFSGTGTVNSVTVRRLGPGATGDFSNVYLYEGARRLVSGKTISSSTGEVTFSNLSWAVSGSKELSVVGDYSSATAGNVNYLQISAVSATVTVSGLPVSGNNMTVSGTNSGTITQAKVGSLANPNAGAANFQMSEFKLTANTEAASVKRIQMLQGGTVKPADLTNLKLKTGSSEWSGSINSKGEMVFDLGSGFTITKGNNSIFKVYGDVAGKKDETIALYFEYATDIYAVGDQYGYGMAVTLDANMDDSTNTHVLTLQGGILTATFVGPTAADIGTNTDDTLFLRFSLAAASNIDIKKTRLNLSLDDAGDGTWDDLGTASVSNGFQDLDDIKITDEDTGKVLAGPVDGSSFTTDETDGNPSGTSAAQYAFSDEIDLTSGQVLHAKVTADLKQSNTRTGTKINNNSKVAISLGDYSDDIGLTEKKYTNTNTQLAATDIVPNAHIHGPGLTVKSSALTLGLAANPADQTVVKGSQGIDSVGITFTAANASALKVTDITLTGYSDADGSGAFDKGSAGDIASMVASVALYEKESGALIASSPSANNLAAAAGTLVYNNLNWNIPAGATKTLLVRVNLLNLDIPTKKHFGFDVAATTDVTALDSSSVSINSGNATPNGATSITTDVTVSNVGNILVSEDDSSPSKSKKQIYWGQTGVEVSRFKVRTINEAFFIDRFNLTSADAADAKNNVKNVYLYYQDKNGAEQWAQSQLNADTTPSVSFSFTGDLRPYIPKDSSRTLKVKIDTVATSQAGATSNVDFALNFSGGASDEFEATGEGSLTKINGNDSSGGDATVSVTATNKVLVYRTYPKFTAVPMSNGATSGQSVVGKFDITANGALGSQMVFGTVAASGSITFDTLSSGSGTPTFVATLYDDATGQILDTVTVSSAAKNASVAFEGFTNALSIDANATKRIRVEANLSSYNTPVNTAGVGADYFQLILQGDQAAMVKWIDGSASSQNVGISNTNGYTESLPAYGPYLTGQ